MAVTLVTEDQQQDNTGNLVDMFVITFTVDPHPGTFTVTVPQAPGDPVAAAQAAIAAVEQQVNSLYGL